MNVEIALRVIVVIPTYNERENLPHLVPILLSLEKPVDVLVVDDASPDGTGEFADALSEADRRVKVLHRQRKSGLGTAYTAGFRYALDHGYDLVVEMDADFSHRPEDLPALIEQAARADVVIGSRNVPGGRTVGWSPLRRLLSKGGSLYARLLLRLPVRDCTSGFKCFRRSAIEALEMDSIHSNGYGFQVEVNYACARRGLRFAEVPITFPDRTRGASKMSTRIVLEAWLMVLALRLRRHGETLPFNRPSAVTVARRRAA
jgi:dolichol-phosphate mannosyltransferase